MADDKKPKEDEVVEETNVDVEPEQPKEVEETPESTEPEDTTEEPKVPNKLQQFLKLYKSKKKISIPATVVLAVLILLGLPLTRYPILGLFIKSDFYVTVLDNTSGHAITGVDIKLGGQPMQDVGGQYKARVKVGRHKLTINKKYYKDFSATALVPVKQGTHAYVAKMTATGQQVSVTVTNKVSGKAVENAVVKAADTEAKTDKDGLAIIVLPPDKNEVEGTVSGDGFNETKVKISLGEITIGEETANQNKFTLTPTGKVYFLSKKSGKIDLVKTDLDGGNRQTVLPGTGKEEDRNTILLASRDWKYLALLSRRDDTKAKLYLVETGSDKVTEIDSGDATFSITGWQDHFFVYRVDRNTQVWKGKHQALKSYNAESKTLTTIDETAAEGTGQYDYVNNSIENIYTIKDNIIYTKTWSGSYYSNYRLAGKRSGFYSVKQNGSSKQTLNDFDAPEYGYINAILAEPEEIYYSVYTSGNDKNNYFEYKDGKITEVKDEKETSEWFDKTYPTFLLSPDGTATFWSESRDGKNTLLIGNTKGESSKEVASLSELLPYGWFTEDYLLVSKKDSELYILPAGESVDEKQVIKVSDYHKPSTSFLGYGGGYGGL